MPGSAISAAVILLLMTSVSARSSDLANSPQFQSAHLVTLGDRMFREARFEEAERAYLQALGLDPNSARGHLGLGRIAALLSDSRGAAMQYSAAYQLAPRDPDAILAFAGVVENATARQTLLRNFLAYSQDARSEDVRGKLQVAERVGSGPVASIDSPYQPYKISLFPMGTTGLFLRAKVNGTELKLIVDTGASGIVLNASAASEMKLEYLADAALAGYGAAAPAGARVARAASFETGGLKIGNILIHVSDGMLSPQANGWIGLDVFKEFLIRLDARRRTMELTPFGNADGICADCVRAYRLGALLLVRGTVNGQSDGYFILDSGSAYSMVSRRLVPANGTLSTFKGAQGGQDVAVPSDLMSIRIGQRRFLGFAYATLDTTEISTRNGTEIAGAIGYSVLRDLRLTVNYRDGLLKFAKSGSE